MNVKKLITCISFFMAGVVLSVSAYAEVVDRIVAIVNEEIITLSELNTAFEPYQKKITDSYKGQDLSKILPEGRLAVLNKLIDQNLIEQEAKKSGITVKDGDLMDTINDMLARRKMKMDDLLKSLAKDGHNLESYKKDVRDQMVRSRLVRREIKYRVAVSDEEIGDYYLKHREDYEGKEAVRINQIIIQLPKNIDAATKEKLSADIGMIHKKLKAGEPFDMLAAQYSQGPAAATGGDIGFVERGMILPAVENVAFKLRKDEISEVIESPIGFHIIKVIDRRGAGIKPIEFVRAEIREKLEEEKMEKKYMEWIKELRDKSLIEIKL
jgi:peptidyl-prolyl cis-trans isomerase SurA